jgi:hypothetical protein
MLVTACNYTLILICDCPYKLLYSWSVAICQEDLFLRPRCYGFYIPLVSSWPTFRVSIFSHLQRLSSPRSMNSWIAGYCEGYCPSAFCFDCLNLDDVTNWLTRNFGIPPKNSGYNPRRAKTSVHHVGNFKRRKNLYPHRDCDTFKAVAF